MAELLSTVSPPPSEEDPHNIELWNKKWAENKIAFHKNQVHPALIKHSETVTGQKLTDEAPTDSTQIEQNSKKTWFLPLCGKSLDIPYLLSQGFRVFGVEAVKMAVEALNTEHSLGMTYDEKEKLFTGANGRLQIYVGDLFTCPMEKYGPYDYVWDRGSFVAIEYASRKDYSNVMQKALKKSDGSWYNFSYLLEGVMYDKSKFPGPPRSVSDEDMQEFYGSWANFQILSVQPLMEGSTAFKALNGEGSSRFFHITPKV